MSGGVASRIFITLEKKTLWHYKKNCQTCQLSFTKFYISLIQVCASYRYVQNERVLCKGVSYQYVQNERVSLCKMRGFASKAMWHQIALCKNDNHDGDGQWKEQCFEFNFNPMQHKLAWKVSFFWSYDMLLVAGLYGQEDLFFTLIQLSHFTGRGHVNASFMRIWRVLETTDAFLRCFCVTRTQNYETQSRSNNCSNRVQRALQLPEMTGLVNMFVHALVFVVVVHVFVLSGS